jgi:hypothetical protein
VLFFLPLFVFVSLFDEIYVRFSPIYLFLSHCFTLTFFAWIILLYFGCIYSSLFINRFPFTNSFTIPVFVLLYLQEKICIKWILNNLFVQFKFERFAYRVCQSVSVCA